jgi:HD-GYP domain-containing protein (c-di-GMP phosphodiesterase class II)
MSSADRSKLVHRARRAEGAGRHHEAIHLYEAALRTASDGDSTFGPAQLLRWIGSAHAAAGDAEAALDCYQASEAAARAVGSAGDVAHVVNCRGIIFFELGRLEEANRLFLEALQRAEECGEAGLVAMAGQNLGNVESVRGNPATALRWYVRSLRRYRELGVTEHCGPLLHNIGRAYTALGSWHEAESAFRCAETSCDTSHQASYKILIRLSRARMEQARSRLGPALAACRSARELSEHLGAPRWRGELLRQEGELHRRLGRPALAEEALQAALAEARRRRTPLLEAEVHRERARLLQEQGRHQEMLRCLNGAWAAYGRLQARHDLAELRRTRQALEQSFQSLVRDWSDSIESVDRYTRGHCDRVADHACSLATAAGMESWVLPWFRMGALLHDVGKVRVPSEILNKPGPLDDAEWEVMKAHPRAGVDLLADVDFPWDIRPMVLHHHERWDGGGYPGGLAGEDIPLPARILCVADVFDALTSHRSYRPAHHPGAALEIMAREAGRAFDPEIFALFRETSTLASPTTFGLSSVSAFR